MAPDSVPLRTTDLMPTCLSDRCSNVASSGKPLWAPHRFNQAFLLHMLIGAFTILSIVCNVYLLNCSNNVCSSHLTKERKEHFVDCYVPGSHMVPDTQ